MHWGAVEWNPGRFKLNAVPDRYRFQLSMPEFERINGEFDAKKKSWRRTCLYRIAVPIYRPTAS